MTNLYLWTIHSVGLLGALMAIFGCQANAERSELGPSVVSEATPAVQEAAEAQAQVVVWVNDTAITPAEVDRRLDQLQRLYRNSKRPFDDAQREAKRREVIDRLIDRELLRQHVRSQEIVIGEDEVEAELRRRVTTVFGHRDALGRFLADQDMSLAEYRARIRSEIASRRMFEIDGEEPVASDAEIRELYERIAARRPAPERVEASVIQVRVPPDTTEPVRRRMQVGTERAMGRIRTPEQFGEFARKMSQGPAAARGGYVGWIERGALPAQVEAAVFATAPGQMSALASTASGFEIYWVHQKRPAGPRQLDEIADVLRDRARQERIDQRRRRLLDELREAADIRYVHDPAP